MGAFKAGVLEDLTARVGLRFVAAYGNAPTDICAYAEAGIDPAVTNIVGSHGGEACDDGEPTQAVSDYRDHLNDLGASTLP